jgi:cell division protein FtsX
MYSIAFRNNVRVGVLLICVLVFTVFLYCFFYVYLFLFITSVKDYRHRVKTQLQ